MTQVYTKSVQNPESQRMELQQKQMMMLGIASNNKQQKLSQEIIRKIRKDYVSMYFAFTSIYWARGESLGGAWAKAFNQMDSYIKSKMKIANHPANNALIKSHNEYRQWLNKTLATNPYVNDKLEERQKKWFMDYGTKTIKESKGNLDKIHQQYMPQKTMGIANKTQLFGSASQQVQQMLQQLLMRQRIHARGVA